jgi:iron complex outermembrane receptor protein
MAFCGVLLLASLLHATTAQAQRVDDNAVTAADDAFGNTVGFQTIGLYSPTSARGFSPTQAENLRIEGLYFDQQTYSSNPLLFSRSDMRIGIAAQSYSFPSPTGIADYKLRIPGDTELLSAVATHGPLDMSTIELDGQYSLVPQVLSIGINVMDWNNFDYALARRSASRGISTTLRIKPSEQSEIVPFVGYTYSGEHEELPIVFADGIDAPPVFNQEHLPTQSWSSWGWDELTAGVVAKSALSNSWNLTGGLFHSAVYNRQSFIDLLLTPLPSGQADHIMDVIPPLAAQSYSGDVRLSWVTTSGPHTRDLTLAVRGRASEREFGGDSITDLGSISIFKSASVPEPALRFSSTSTDDVRQVGLGASYNEKWQDVGSLSVGVLQTDYRRTLTTSGVGSAPERMSQLLPTGSFTLDLGRYASMYASYTRGLEDSAVAPPSAVNHGEPPPATTTWQADGGFRLVPTRGVSVLLGAFEVHKAYFNLDSADRYDRIGNISSQGFEGSVTVANVAGLKIVGGIVLLKPRIDAMVARLGGMGEVPLGPVPRTINVNVDYAPADWGRWAVSAQWKSLSSRVEVNNDEMQLPALSTLNLGVRSKCRFFDRPCSIRLDAANVTNERGLTLSSLYLITPQLGRNYTITFSTDI